MGFIKLFILGTSGYLLSGLFDLAILYNKPTLKKILTIGFVITAIPYVILLSSYSSPIPLGGVLIIFILLLLFIALLIFSVFIETSLTAQKPSAFYQQGTYSISRHPGFLWYTAINILLAIYFWDYRITLLCAGFCLDNLILISIEDTFIFPKMFPNYQTYKKQTPFLLSIRSIAQWRGLK